MTPDINLLAPARPGRRVDVLVAAGVLIVLASSLSTWTYAITKHLDRLRGDLSVIHHDVGRLRIAAQHAQQLSREAERLRLRVTALQQAEAPQVPVSQVLELIRSATPTDVWLTGVAARSSTVTLDGYTVSYPSVAGFLITLDNSGSLRHVRLLTSQTELLLQQQAVKFRITADFVGTEPTASRTERVP